MKTIKIQLEYQCYPVWLYDDAGFVEDNALPPELADDVELDQKFHSAQKRFDATYVDTATEFFNKGFASPDDEAAFKDDLKTAIAELIEKCGEGYMLEVAPDLLR